MTTKTLQRRLIRLALASLLGLTPLSGVVMAQTPSPALTGKVSSQRESAMEGVLVTAKRDSSNIGITVVSDASGEYRFPRERLQPGHYSVQIRAVGYELSGASSVDVSPQSTATLDLRLIDTQNLAHQLSSGEWLHSIPGTDAQKQQFLNCVGCHTLERPFTSTFNADEMAAKLQLMSTFANNAMPGNPQQVSTAAEILARPPTQAQRELGAYVASLNLSSGPEWSYPLKTLPRPTGKATQVIITSYDLPRPLTMVHDVTTDAQGTIWYDDFGSQHLGKLNPSTGEVVEYEVPELKPGFPKGFLDLELDQDGRLYLGNMGQAQVVRFDPRSERVETFPAANWDYPDERVTFVKPQYSHLDGTLWVNLAATPDGNRSYQVDLDTWTWTRVEYPPDVPVRGVNAYDIPVDLNNNVYGLQNQLDTGWIWRTDSKTLLTTWFAIPTGDGGGRRGRTDSQNRLWWAQYQANRVATFDPATETIQQWQMPTDWTNPYDAAFDDKQYIWTGSMLNDFVVRLNVDTGEFTQYLLPSRTNIRRVNVIKSADLSGLWVGDNHGARILKIEPLSP
jgi:virginiamycin B lyase